MSSVRILLVEDHALIRAGIRALLEAMDGVRVVRETDNGREAAALAEELRPDIVVMDISMRELNGIESTRQIVAQGHGARVLILSMHAEEDFVRRAMKAGASGYLTKDSALAELAMAIAALQRGEIYLSSRVSRHVVSALTDAGDPTASPLDSLTPRQSAVLQMIAEGNSTKETAAALGVSVKTVETHRATIMARLGLRDLAALVMFAARHKIISLEEP